MAMSRSSVRGGSGQSSAGSPQKVDVLEQRLEIVYKDYNRKFDGPPDYIFKLCGMSALITKDTYHEGQKFHTRSPRYEAQLKCRVRLAYIRLSLAIFSESSTKRSTKLPSKLQAIIRRSRPFDDIYLTCNVESERHFETFYAFCGFTFTEKLRNREDSLLIHLYVQNEWEARSVSESCLRWKVDFSNADIIGDLSKTPLFYEYAEGFRVQLQLYVLRENVSVEYRFVRSFSEESTKFWIIVKFIHPKSRQLDIVKKIDFHETFKPEEKFLREFTTKAHMATMEQLKPFLRNNKLLVKADLKYYE